MPKCAKTDCYCIEYQFEGKHRFTNNLVDVKVEFMINFNYQNIDKIKSLDITNYGLWIVDIEKVLFAMKYFRLSKLITYKYICI